jgi:hypothetical protein
MCNLHNYCGLYTDIQVDTAFVKNKWYMHSQFRVWRIPNSSTHTCEQGKDGEINIHEEMITILLIIIRDTYGKSRFDMESI